MKKDEDEILDKLFYENLKNAYMESAELDLKLAEELMAVSYEVDMIFLKEEKKNKS